MLVKEPTGSAAFMTRPMRVSHESLLQRFYRWFHSFDEDEDAPTVTVETPEDGARIGMVGWY
jgi:hypothetical protein